VEPLESRWIAEHLRSPAADSVSALEKEVAKRVGVENAAAVSSGRQGLRMILDYLAPTAGDEVIVSAYTLGALLPLLQDHGLRAVPADIDQATLNITPATVHQRMTDRTRLVLALHAFGCPCEIDQLQEICRHRGISLIEDCAHSFGATLGGRQTGSFGEAGFFSFEATKPLNTYGGGMVVTREEALIEAARAKSEPYRTDTRAFLKKVRSVRVERLLFASGLAMPILLLLATPALRRGMEWLYRAFQSVPPTDLRYLPVQASLGLKKLSSLDNRIAERQKTADLYRSLLKPSIRMQQVPENASSTWYFVVAVLPTDAAPIRRRMLLRGIDAGMGNEIADNCARLLGFTDCPVTDRVSAGAIALPVYDGIPDSSVRKVASVLNRLV